MRLLQRVFVPFVLVLAVTGLAYAVQSQSVSTPAGGAAGGTAATRPSDNAAADKLIAVGRDNNKVMEHLDFLVNRIGPRLTSSDSGQYAGEWTRDQFKSFGLDAKLEQWGEFPVGFNRGPWSGKMVQPVEMALEFGTQAWTAGTRGPQRGAALLAPTNDEQLTAVSAKLKGAWILVPPAAGGGRGAGGAAGGGRGAGVGPATAPGGAGGAGGGAGGAAAGGAAGGGGGGGQPDAGFRQRLDAAYAAAPIAGYVRSTNNELIVTGGSYRINWNNLPTVPSVNLVKRQFDDIATRIRDGKEVVLEFDIRNHFKQGPIKLYNVIADIPGAELPNEYVIVGGHLDSWDGATGTTDNGTGIATAMEAARIIMASGLKPKRTIRFMLWTGEEQGLLGSAAYVRAHPEIMSKISGVLVHDAGTNYLSGISATDAFIADMEMIFDPIKRLNPALPFQVRRVAGLTGGGSDHASFLSAGAPGLFWSQAGRANYTQTHHTQFDTFDRAIVEYQQHSSIVIAVGAFGIANLDHMLSREGMTQAGRGRRGGAGAPTTAPTTTPTTRAGAVGGRGD